MVRYVLFFAFAVSFAPAATISTSATCDGVTTVGTVSASCNDGLFEAHASASQTSVFVDAGFSSFMSSGGSATASFSADYVFTVNGGTGNGFFFPCFSGIAGEGSEGDAGGGFGGISYSVHAPGCAAKSLAFPQSIPFTFGLPQIASFGMGGFASPSKGRGEANANVSFGGFLFFDAPGNQLSNVTFTLVEVPEPSAVSLLSVGFLFFLAVPMIRSVAH